MSIYNAMGHVKASDLQSLKKRLQTSGLKATSARLELLKALAKADRPTAAETFFERLKKTCDLVTIYRNLNAFEEAGLVFRVDLGLDRDFFELQGALPHHHHHILCRSCEEIEHVDICGLDTHIKFLESLGFSQIQHRLEFSGLCQNCKTSDPI